jgi:hypothetical protein
MTRASAACRRLMTIPGVGQLTALAFVAAIDDPSRICRSRDIGAYLGLVPRRYQSGEVDHTGGISKCGDRRLRTPLYEAPMSPDPLQGPAQTQGLGLRHREAINDAQSASRSGSPARNHHARDTARWDRVRIGVSPLKSTRQEAESSSKRSDVRGREQTTAPILLHAANQWLTAISTKPPCTQLTPSSAKRARRERRHPTASTPRKSLSPLTH